jgi:four helix bundle protein
MEREPARRFVDLLVWQKSHALVLAVYGVTRGFPREEQYGLAAQLRRAAVSVPANIAEAFKKRGRADKARLLNVAEGSLEETRYYLILACDLGYPVETGLDARVEEVARLLGAYTESILRSVRQSARVSNSERSA